MCIPRAGKPQMGRRPSRQRPPSLLVVVLAVVAALTVRLPATSANAAAPAASLTVFYRSCYQPATGRFGSADGCVSGLVMRVNRCRNGATDLFVATDEQEDLRRYACRTGNSSVVTRNEVSIQVIPVRMKGHLIAARGRATTYESVRATRR